MYAVTSIPLVRRTRAILRSAELGFFGVVVVTFVQTPRLKGELWKTGLFKMLLKLFPSAIERDFFLRVFLGRFTSWFVVGIKLNKSHRRQCNYSTIQALKMQVLQLYANSCNCPENKA